MGCQLASPSGWAHHGSMGGRVHGTCQRYNAVSIMSVRVYPTTRVVVVVVVVLSVDIPCISSMPQAQFDICAFHPCWLVSWTAREHCVDPRRSGILSSSAALDIRWKDPVIATIGQQSLCCIRQTIVTQEEELREGVVARPDRVGWWQRGGMVCLNIAPAHSRHWQIAVPPSFGPKWWCALYNTSSLYDVCCVSELAEKSSQMPGERRKGTARGLGVSERAQCCRERPIARRRPPRLRSYRKQLLNVAMPMLNCPYYRALYQGGAASCAGRGKRGGEHCTVWVLNEDMAPLVCCMNRLSWTRCCGGVCLGPQTGRGLGQCSTL